MSDDGDQVCFYHDEEMRAKVEAALNMDSLGPVEIIMDYARGKCKKAKPFVFPDGARLVRWNTCMKDNEDFRLVFEKGEEKIVANGACYCGGLVNFSAANEPVLMIGVKYWGKVADACYEQRVVDCLIEWLRDSGALTSSTL